MKEHKAIIFAQGLDDRSLVEFESNGDRATLKALKQSRGPCLDRFWTVLQDLNFSFVRARDLQADIMFSIGPIEANKRGKLIGR